MSLRESVYKTLRPFIFLADPETAHERVVKTLRKIQKSAFLLSALKAVFKNRKIRKEVAGIRFENPVGLAAGFDKNAEIYKILSAVFGFVEVGTITFRPQKGNPKPRLFRYPRHKAIINRMGFNNVGAETAAKNLEKNGKAFSPLGINIGKNSDYPLETAHKNYIDALSILHPFADYIAINISCPNIKDLNKLHEKKFLENFLGEIKNFAEKKNIKKPFFLKISPDVEKNHLFSIVKEAEKTGFGIICGNTSSDKKIFPEGGEKGGISGGPLAEKARQKLADARRLTKKTDIISCGGIMDPEDAAERLARGADLVQIYSGLVYNGPFFVKDILSCIYRESKKTECEKEQN